MLASTAVTSFVSAGFSEPPIVYNQGMATRSQASLALWTPEDILLRLATHPSDRLDAIHARRQLLEEQSAAQAELDLRFSHHLNALATQELELDFLDHIQVLDGCPVYFEDDGTMTTGRTFAGEGAPARTAIFKSGIGESTLGINASPGKDGFRSFHFPSSSLAHGHALRWLVDGVVPPESFALSPEEPGLEHASSQVLL
jgi:hypothetical protein